MSRDINVLNPRCIQMALVVLVLPLRPVWDLQLWTISNGNVFIYKTFMCNINMNSHFYTSDYENTQTCARLILYLYLTIKQIFENSCDQSITQFPLNNTKIEIMFLSNFLFKLCFSINR